MSTFHQVSLPCTGCRKEQSLRLVESANVARHPPFRQEVLSGNFMRFLCPSCNTPTVVERELLYSDLPRHECIAIFPRIRIGEALQLEAEWRFSLSQLQQEPGLSSQTQLWSRMVFGYAELREKLILHQAGLDDHLLEGLKFLLLAQGPWKGLQGLLLVDVQPGELIFELIGPDAGTRRTVPVHLLQTLDLSLVRELLGIPQDALWVSLSRRMGGL